MKKHFLTFTFLYFTFLLTAQRQNQWRNYLDPTPLPNIDFAFNGQNLWIPTQGGLLYFNTLTEKHKIYQPDSCTIKGVNILSVCADTASGVWFSTKETGLQHFDGQNFRYFPNKNNGEPLSLIKKIQIDNQGRVWMLHLTDNSARPTAEILMFDGQTWKNYLRDSLLYNEEFAIDKDGVCWFNKYGVSSSYDHRIMAYNTQNGQMMRFDSLNSALKLKNNIPIIRTDKSGNAWLSYGGDNKSVHLHQLKTTVWKTYKTSTFAITPIVKSLSFGNDGAVYVTEEWNTHRLKDTSWLDKPFYDYGIQKFMPIDSVNSWVIGYDLDTYTLFRMGNAKKYSFIDEKSVLLKSNLINQIMPIFGNHPRNNNLYNQTFTFDGRAIKSNTFYSLHAAFDGDSLLWMSGNTDARFFDFRTNRITYVPSPTERGIYPQKILIDKFANKWALCRNLYPLQVIDRNRTITQVNFFLPLFRIYSIRDLAIDKASNIWVVGDSGLIKRNVITGYWAFVPLPDSVKKFIRRINIDEGDHIWLDVNGLCYQYSEPNGLKLLNIQKVALQTIDSSTTLEKFVSYRNNTWWFATAYGLVRYDGQNYQAFDTKNSPMVTKNISSVFTDKLGNLWMNHIHGLTVFNENNLVDLRTPVKEVVQQTEMIISQMSPNPLSKNGILRFENTENQFFELTIFDANGRIMGTQTTQNSYFLIQTNAFPNGIYFYKLKTQERMGQGKFVVQE